MWDVATILAMTVLAICFAILTYPHKAGYYYDRTLIAFGLCPRCHNKMTDTGKYKFCPNCGKR